VGVRAGTVGEQSAAQIFGLRAVEGGKRHPRTVGLTAGQFEGGDTEATLDDVGGDLHVADPVRRERRGGARQEADPALDPVGVDAVAGHRQAGGLGDRGGDGPDDHPAHRPEEDPADGQAAHQHADRRRHRRGDECRGDHHGRGGDRPTIQRQPVFMVRAGGAVRARGTARTGEVGGAVRADRIGRAGHVASR